MSLHRFRILLMVVLLFVPVFVVSAQDAPKKADPVELPKINDEPRLIDPITVLPKVLTTPVTVDLTDSSIRELVEWLRKEQGIAVLIEQNALNTLGILPEDPISDRLDNSPIYMMLDRLRSLDVAWFYEDDLLHITSVASERNHLLNIPYNLGDLLDASYKMRDLASVIQNTIQPDSWDRGGGIGALNSLGDVMFVRQTQAVHREIQGLLAALRKHGRQTLVLESPVHLQLSQKLSESTSVNFDDTPLDAAIKEISADLAIDIRLDLVALRKVRIRGRQPITIRLEDRMLETILQSMLMDLELTWVVRDGVLWITSNDVADETLKMAVYDVRDLCRDGSESAALLGAVTQQTSAESWDSAGGPGDIQFAKPGTMVVYNQGKVLKEVFELLESYRLALKASKPRERDKLDPEEVITVYYRLHTNVANDLTWLLPKLIQPETWNRGNKPERVGEIILAASPAEVESIESSIAFGSDDEELSATTSLVMARSVLIIKQTRKAHDEISEVLRRVESGDGRYSGGKGSFGGGGGGFGGGFFSIPSRIR